MTPPQSKCRFALSGFGCYTEQAEDAMESYSLFDAHCHLQDERLAGRLDAVLDRARLAGVTRFACCGTCEADWPAVAALARRERGVMPSFGLHPWRLAGRSRDWLAALESMLSACPEAGVGEIGLDHAMRDRDPAAQEETFLAQIDLARRMNRPISLHCRQAWAALLDLLGRGGPLPAGFVVHAYSGSAETIAALTRLNGFISFSGPVTRRGNRRVRTAAPAVPDDRLLVETDAPDLMPMLPDGSPAIDDGPNEPACLIHVAREVAALRQTGLPDLARLTSANAGRLFGQRSQGQAT